MKRTLLFVLGLGISVAACFWVAQKTDLSSAWAEITHLGPGTIAGLLAVFSLGFYFRAVRSKLMMAPAGVTISTAHANEAIVLGCAANNVLPLRLGELVRTFFTASLTQCPRSTALACVATERVTDLCMLTIVLLGALISTVLHLGEIPTALKTLLVPSAALLVGIVFFFASTRIVRLLLQRWENRLPPKLVRLISRLLDSAAFLKDPKRLASVAVLSLLVWLCEGGVYCGSAAALGIPNPILTGYLTLAVVNLTILLPSSPGYVGVFHAAAIFAVTPLGVDPAVGLALGLVCHGLPFLTVTLAGLVVFLRHSTVILGFKRASLDGDA